MHQLHTINLVNYDSIVYNKTIDEWVNILHKYNCSVNNWKYTPLKRGCFGYDNLVYSIYMVHENNVNADTPLELIAEYIHDGWCKNYIYCEIISPVKLPYIKPAKPLGDERRNTCASQKYSELDNEEKEKDLVLARCIKSNIQS
jgi:hypothetical protein